MQLSLTGGLLSYQTGIEITMFMKDDSAVNIVLCLIVLAAALWMFINSDDIIGKDKEGRVKISFEKSDLMLAFIVLAASAILTMLHCCSS